MTTDIRPVTTNSASSGAHRQLFPTMSPMFLFSALSLMSLAIWWRPLSTTLSLALDDDQFTHILLILPISVALIFLDWKSPEPAARHHTTVPSILLVTSFLTTALVRWKAAALPEDVELALSMLALIVWWVAAFHLSFGDRAFRRALFPLFFLLWMVPLPDFLLDPIVALLQQGSAASAHFLFAAAGVPVVQRGMLVHIPGLTVEVARECSSIRSSSMLVVTTMVLAHLLLRSPWRKALVIGVAIPFSIAKNGLRIFTIAMLATRVDRSFLTGRLHRQGGIIFFLIALVVIFLLLWILRRREERGPGERNAAPTPENNAGRVTSSMG